jgi:hypothetical protein
MKYFVFRKVKPSIFQLVYIDNHNVVHAAYAQPHGVINYTTYRWHIVEKLEISEDEHRWHLSRFRNDGIKFSKWSLQSVDYPELSFRICSTSADLPPKSHGLRVSFGATLPKDTDFTRRPYSVDTTSMTPQVLKDIHTGVLKDGVSGVHEIHAPVRVVAPVPAPVPVQRPQAAAPTATPTVHRYTPAAAPPPTITVVPQPMIPTFPTLGATIMLPAAAAAAAAAPAPKLAEFVAKIVAADAVAKSLDCPVALESLRSFEKVGVSFCGHVCSEDAAKMMATCPICRQKTQWTVVSTH